MDNMDIMWAAYALPVLLLWMAWRERRSCNTPDARLLGTLAALSAAIVGSYELLL